MRIIKKYQGTVPENRIMSTKTNSDIDTYSCNYVNDRHEWKLLSSGISYEVSKTLPSNFNELYIELFVGGYDTSIIYQFIIPRVALSSSTKSYRTGASYTSSVYGGGRIVISTSKVYFCDTYANGSVKTNSKMDIYYR